MQAPIPSFAFKLLILLCLGSACGSKSGGGESNPPAAEPDGVEVPEAEEVKLQYTAVPYLFQQSYEPEGLNCQSSMTMDRWPDAEKNAFTLHLPLGALGAPDSALFQSKASLAMRAWFQQDALWLQIQTLPQTLEGLVLEFGGIAESEDALRIERRSTFRVEHGDLIDLSSGQSVAKLQSAASAVQFAIPVAQLGDIVYWPNFYLRSGWDTQQLAPTAISFIPGLLDLARGSWTISRCLQWRDRALPEKVAMDALFPSDAGEADAAATALSLARMAVEASAKRYSKLAVRAQLPFLVAFKPSDYRGIAKDRREEYGILLDARALLSGYSYRDAKARVSLDALQAYWRYQSIGAFAFADADTAEDAAQILAFALSASEVDRLLGRRDLVEFLKQRSRFNRRPQLKGYGILLGLLLLQRDSSGGIDSAEVYRELSALQGGSLDPLAFVEDLVARTRPDLQDVALIRSLFDPQLYDSEDFSLVERDRDGDGLIDLAELVFRSNPDLADSDRDGWNDYAELLAASDHRNPNQAPKRLVQDGDLFDWFRLVPGKMVKLETEAGSCPSGIRIGQYAAIASAKELIIAASLQSKEAALAATDVFTWDIKVILNKQKRALSVNVGRGEDAFVVKSHALKQKKQTVQAMRSRQGRFLGERGVELIVDPSEFGLNGVNFLELGAAEVQLRLLSKVKGREVLCAETPLFAPTQHEM